MASSSGQGIPSCSGQHCSEHHLGSGVKEHLEWVASEAPAVSFCTYCWISCTCIDSQHTYFTGWYDDRGTRIHATFAYHIVCATMSKASYSVLGTCGVSPSKGSSSSVKECPARIRRALSRLLASFSSSICHFAHKLLIRLAGTGAPLLLH